VSGGTIKDAGNHAANFNGISGLSASLQIGPSPLTVTSLSVSPTGQVVGNQNVFLTLQMSEAFTVGQTGPNTLTLNDGGIGFYDSTDSNPSTGKAVFEYPIGTSEDVDTVDRALNLEISGAQVSMKDANGYNADFSAALNVGTGVQIGPSPYVVDVTTDSQAREADAGQTVHIILTMSGPVTVNTSGGSPIVVLNDGAQATYDSGASNPAGGTLVFDYTVGVNDRAEFLAVQNFNLHGAVIQDGSGHNADFTLALGRDVNVIVNTMEFELAIGPATVVALSSSQIGRVDQGQTIHLGVEMSRSIVINTAGGLPTLTLNDGATATYDAALSNASGGSLMFDYTLGANDHAPDLRITSVNLNGAVITDYNGSNVDFARVLNAPSNVQVAATVGAKVDDVLGSGYSDILFRNDASGDTWFEAMKNGLFQGWHPIGGSSTAYAAVGTGDFYGNGTADILYRNNSTGDTWFEARATVSLPAGIPLAAPTRAIPLPASATSSAMAPTTCSIATIRQAIPGLRRSATGCLSAGARSVDRIPAMRRSASAISMATVLTTSCSATTLPVTPGLRR
jgi:hypothetical protein